MTNGNTAPIAKIIHFSAVDGPGNRTAIFLQGCNQHCSYCHNPETINLCANCGECVKACPTGAVFYQDGGIHYDIERCCLCDECIKTCRNLSSPRIRRLDAGGTLDLIKIDLPFIQGITVSGGECTLYPGYMAELFALIKAKGKTAFIDTNGQIPFTQTPRLVNVMDKAMIDLKSADDEEHKALSGRSVYPVFDNISYLARRDKLFEIRTVVVPGILDNERTVTTGADMIAPYPNIRYKLIRYRPFGVQETVLRSAAYTGVQTPDIAYMNKLAGIVRKRGVKDIVIT
jgi:pyruvate formate lyase activating enzyme